MFGIGAAASFGVFVLFVIASAIAIFSFGPTKANAFVLPGAAMLWGALAVYLAMLGIIGEVALARDRKSSTQQLPLARPGNSTS